MRTERREPHLAMAGHIHIGLMPALTAFAMVASVGVIWRVIALLLHNTRVGQAMSFVY